MLDRIDWYGIWQDPNVKSAVVSIVVAVVTEIVRRAITPKANIAWGVAHQHFFLIPAPENQIAVRTRQIFVQNTGRTSAEDVEVTLNFAPQYLDVWPPAVCNLDQKGRFLIVKASNLNKKEFFTIDMISHSTELPDVIGVRWKGGVAKQKIIGPSQVFPRWVQRLALGLMLIGAISCVFVFARFIIALS